MLPDRAETQRNSLKLFRTYSPSIAPPQSISSSLPRSRSRTRSRKKLSSLTGMFPGPGSVLLSAIHDEGRLKKQANALTPILHTLYVCLNSIVLGGSHGPGYIFIFKPPYDRITSYGSRHDFPGPVHRLRSHLSTLIRLVRLSVIVHGNFDHRNRSRLHDINALL